MRAKSLDYHPDPFKTHRWHDRFTRWGGQRNVYSRLGALLQHYDFRDKKILDLGCNRGFYAFSLALRGAKSVVAVDGDKELINQNEEMAKKKNIQNILFLNKKITVEEIQPFSKFDVVLFLSVLHHIMVGTPELYPFNSEGKDIAYAVELLKEIARHTDCLFFEMGQSDEFADWAARLPRMEPSAAIWISEHLLKPAGFLQITIIEPPEWEGFNGKIRKFLRKYLSSTLDSQHLAGRLLRRIFNYHQADRRILFLASK